MHSAVLDTASCHHKHDIVGISPSSERRTWPEMSVSITRLGYANQHCIPVECLLLLCLMLSQTGDIYTDTLWKISAVM